MLQSRPEEVVVAIPVTFALNLAVGSSLVLASRSTVHDESLLRSSCLWVLLALEAIVVFPVGAYLLWRFPDWSLMYILEPADLPSPLWAVAASSPIAGLIGFAVTRALVRRGRPSAGLGFLVGAILLVVAIGAFGTRQLTSVGTTASFRADDATLPSILETPLIVVLIAGGLVMLGAWGVSLWRLFLIGSSYTVEYVEVEEGEYSVEETMDSKAELNRPG